MWVIVSDPGANVDRVLLANFTTFIEGAKDDTCIVQPWECSALSVESCVFYQEAKFTSAAAIQTAVTAHAIEQHMLEAVSPQLLARIRDGFDRSPHATEEQVRLLAEQGFLDPL